jgi:hypothetical protein
MLSHPQSADNCSTAIWIGSFSSCLPHSTDNGKYQLTGALVSCWSGVRTSSEENVNAARHLRIGTRGSPMALCQTALVRDRLVAAHPELAANGAVEIVTIRTTGDRVQDRLLAEIGGCLSRRCRGAEPCARRDPAGAAANASVLGQLRGTAPLRCAASRDHRYRVHSTASDNLVRGREPAPRA